MKVLSLFDGISCGRVALERAGIKVTKYFACEIKEKSIKVAQSNFPDSIQLGDVTKLRGGALPKIDLLIGGSPCQSFSIAGRQQGFDGESGLFWEYVRLLKELKPRYFLLENVKMKKEWQDIISKELGVEPININSNLVSAQMRNRMYWTNIPDVTIPEDKQITYQSIVTSGIVEKQKAYGLTLHRGNARDYFKKHQSNIVFEPTENGEYEIKDKKITIIFKKSKNQNPFTFNVDLPDGRYSIRAISRIESERLQNLPDNYTREISEAAACDCIGDGWTVDVITHIFRNINQ